MGGQSKEYSTRSNSVASASQSYPDLDEDTIWNMASKLQQSYRTRAAERLSKVLFAKTKLAHTLPHCPQAPVFGASTKSDSGRPTLAPPASSPDQAIRIIELTSVQHSIQDTSRHQRRRTSVPATAVTVLQYQTTTAGGEPQTPGVLELREDAMRNVNESST